jgi:hypothetical protein
MRLSLQYQVVSAEPSSLARPLLVDGRHRARLSVYNHAIPVIGGEIWQPNCILDEEPR